MLANGPDIEAIRRKVASRLIEFTQHATDRSIRRGISLAEILQAIDSGEMVEDYPNDKYCPTCLIFGYTIGQRPLHVQCSYGNRPVVKIVTVYQPDPSQGIDYRTRRSANGV